MFAALPASTDAPMGTAPLPSLSSYDWDRTPAQLEAAVLGCLIGRPDAEAGKVIDQLADEAFSHPHMRAIYRAMRTLRADGLLPDPITVTDRMRAEGTLTDDDALYLVQLPEAAVAPSLLPSLVGKLRVNARRRLMRDLAIALQDAASAPNPDLKGVAALLRTVAEDLDAGRPDAALHDLRVFGGNRRAAHR
jgi:replicative DNA helicase